MSAVRVATVWALSAACVMGCGYKLQGTGASPFLPDHIRVIDESGEDYLYPSSIFVDARLSKTVESAIINAA